MTPLVYLLDATSPIYTEVDQITHLVIVDLKGQVLFNHAFRHSIDPWVVPPAEMDLINSTTLLPFRHYFCPIQALFYSASILITFNNADGAGPFLYDQGLELPDVPHVDVKQEFCNFVNYPPEITSIWDMMSYFNYDDCLTSQNSTLLDLTKATAYAYNKIRSIS